MGFSQLIGMKGAAPAGIARAEDLPTESVHRNED